MHLRDLLPDHNRFTALNYTHDGMYLDVSKNNIDIPAWEALLRLANEAQTHERMNALQSGATLNVTEQRPALHTALRNMGGAPIYVNGADVMPDVNDQFAKMHALYDQLTNGDFAGVTGEPITDVVHIGIGGSYLGPRMAIAALKDYRITALKTHFVSNVDGDHISRVLKPLNPASTLFLVASKTFTTQETMTNVHTATAWSNKTLGDHVLRHFVALTADPYAAQNFGIPASNVLHSWDWDGGRYSLLSDIGLPLMLQIGKEQFDDLRSGAHSIDQHVLTSSLNLPLIMALMGIWNRNYLGRSTEAVVTYNHAMRYFTDYLQQLVMESNGKSTTVDGRYTESATAPVLWGGPGTDAQHSFFQLLHQGSDVVPVDFIGFRSPHHQIGDHHSKLMANMFAQSRALALGRTRQETLAAGADELVAIHKTFAGNRPSNTLLLDKLTPYSLGQLIALYEHKVFYQGVIWGINSFDQMGVELGKVLSKQLLESLGQTIADEQYDPSTQALLSQLKDVY